MDRMIKGRTIKDIIFEDVFTKCFGLGRFKDGKVILQKLFYQYYNILDDFEEQRLILYNLMFAERMEARTENKTEYEKKAHEEMVKVYSEQLKNDMDNIPNYKEDNPLNYCNLLMFYCDTHKEELSDEESTQYYTFLHDYYKKIGSDLEMQCARFNLALVQKNFDIIFEIIKDIGNSDDKRYKSVLVQMLEDVKNIDNQKYNQITVIIENTTKHIV
jgi:hypothetical protein